jgi:hypothetical protein
MSSVSAAVTRSSLERATGKAAPSVVASRRTRAPADRSGRHQGVVVERSGRLHDSSSGARIIANGVLGSSWKHLPRDLATRTQLVERRVSSLRHSVPLCIMRTMANKVKRIPCPERDRAELRRRVASKSLPAREVEKARIVLLAEEGLAARDVAELVGCSESTVLKWRVA